ncbi:hypothetical protein ScSA15_03130 [Streptococcus canis]
MTNTALIGIHHVTAMTNDIERNYQFFTEVLGMRLVKKQLIKMIFTLIIRSLQMTRVPLGLT